MDVRVVRLAPVLLQLLLELDDDEGEVVADEVRAADDHEAPDDGRRDHRRSARPARGPKAWSRPAESTAPPVAPMKKR